jgi:hypothetical protein
VKQGGTTEFPSLRNESLSQGRFFIPLSQAAVEINLRTKGKEET